MDEIEPASDELVAAAEAEASEVKEFWGGTSKIEIAADPMLAILARLRKAERERDEAIAEVRALSEALNCPVNGAHYCPNCDNSLFNAQHRANAWLARAARAKVGGDE